MKNSLPPTALALLLALGTAPAIAAAEWTFSDIDRDGNRELSQDEFEQVSRAVFRSWDADTDQKLSERELYRGIFVSWDYDQNGVLDQQEYEAGSKAWFSAARPRSFAEFDLGGEGTITPDAFARGMGEAGAIEGGGADGMQYRDFHLALFGLYDSGGTGAISEDDYAAKSKSKLVGGPDTVGLTEAEPGTGSALTSGESGAAGKDFTAGNTATDRPDRKRGDHTAPAE